MTNNIYVQAGIRLHVTGVGGYSFIASNGVSTIEVGTQDNDSFIGPYASPCTIGITPQEGSALFCDDTGFPASANINAGLNGPFISGGQSSSKFLVGKMSGPVLRACEFGASFNELNDRFGLGFSSPVNITGAVTVYGNLLFPSGSCLIEYQASTQSIRCTPQGESTGPYVKVSDGIFNIPSGSSENSLRMSIIARLLPNVDRQDTLTSGTRVWSRPNGSWKYQLSFATNEQVQWTPTMGIGGSQSTDIAGRMAQVAAVDADLFFMCASGNDSVTGNLSVSQSISTTLANADLVLGTGRAVILQTIPARYGKSASGADLAFTGEWTAQRQANLVSGNRGYVDGAYARVGMYVADWSAATNSVDSHSAALNGYTADGKHCAGGLAHVAAEANLVCLDAILNGYKFSSNIGGGDYYDATLNPGGNLLQTGQGAFVGTGGTKNTGITNTPSWVTATVYAARAWVISSGNLYYSAAGGTSGATAPTHLDGSISDGSVQWQFISSGVVAGLGDGWTATREGTASAYAHSVTGQDGIRWQEFIVYGSAADENAFRVSPVPPTMANIQTGDKLAFDCDVQLSNSRDCYGLFSDMQLTGGLAVIWDNQSMSSIQQGMQWSSGKLAVEPMAIFSGVTTIQPRLHVQSKASGVFRVRFKNVSVRKLAS